MNKIAEHLQNIRRSIKQNGVVVATFGAGFTTGSAYGPENVVLSSTDLAQVVIHQLGTWT